MDKCYLDSDKTGGLNFSIGFSGDRVNASFNNNRDRILKKSCYCAKAVRVVKNKSLLHMIVSESDCRNGLCCSDEGNSVVHLLCEGAKV